MVSSINLTPEACIHCTWAMGAFLKAILHKVPHSVFIDWFANTSDSSPSFHHEAASH